MNGHASALRAVMESCAGRVAFVPRGDAEVQRRLAELEARGGLVHRFDAREPMSEHGVCAAFAEALRFPGCFGRNWDALVDCLDDLCGAVTGGVGMAGVIHDADLLLRAPHFPLFVSVLCQGADRANSAVDLDGCPLDRPAIDQHFVFEFRDFDPEEIARRVRQRDLVVTVGSASWRQGSTPRSGGCRSGPPQSRCSTAAPREDPAETAPLHAGQVGSNGREAAKRQLCFRYGVLCRQPDS
jgi:hypothetical protein